jgi:hypothetical protein
MKGSARLDEGYGMTEPRLEGAAIWALVMLLVAVIIALEVTVFVK